MTMAEGPAVAHTNYTLVIGDKNFSSWSLRPWLALKQCGIQFAEERVRLRQPDSKATILRWAAQGVLPRPVIVHGGRRGRLARWPLHTSAQGRWVLTQLEAHLTWAEIRAALEAGRFDPSVPEKANR